MKINEPSDMTDYNPMRKSESVLLNDLANIFRNFNTKLNPLHLLVVIFSDKDNAYRVVKTCGDIQFGVATQCVSARNVSRINDQLSSNILLKINTKLGGRNFVLNKQNLLFVLFSEDNT